ncbi:MAG: class I SAM-dependent methyltransferase, partial [Flavobacteriaceae bacterium]
EFAYDLNALHQQTKSFVPGKMVYHFGEDREHKALADHEIMEEWLVPVMQAMAEEVAKDGGDILEIGFGLGVSAEMLMDFVPKSYTVIECNEVVIETYYNPWKEIHTDKNIRLVKGLWQDTIGALGQYDGIFFHTYPLNEDEYLQYVNASITFAEHFFSHASAHLKPGGSFTYFSNEIGSLSREHQRALLRHFSSFSIRVISLKMPADVTDTWWANSIVIVKAVK